MLPCPFCGNPANATTDENGVAWFVLCEKCVACGPSEDTPEEAIAAWNCRLRPDMASAVWCATELTCVRALRAICDLEDVGISLDRATLHINDPSSLPGYNGGHWAGVNVLVNEQLGHGIFHLEYNSEAG